MGVHKCDLCNTDYPAAEVVLLRLRWPESGPARIVGPVNEWYAGVRTLCHHCLAQLKSVEIVPPER